MSSMPLPPPLMLLLLYSMSPRCCCCKTLLLLLLLLPWGLPGPLVLVLVLLPLRVACTAAEKAGVAFTRGAYAAAAAASPTPPPPNTFARLSAKSRDTKSSLSARLCPPRVVAVVLLLLPAALSSGMPGMLLLLP